MDTTGFSFDYTMTNPQINTPKGKLYWVVSDYATELTADAVRGGFGALGKTDQPKKVQKKIKLSFVQT